MEHGNAILIILANSMLFSGIFLISLEIDCLQTTNMILRLLSDSKNIFQKFLSSFVIFRLHDPSQNHQIPQAVYQSQFENIFDGYFGIVFVAYPNAQFGNGGDSGGSHQFDLFNVQNFGEKMLIFWGFEPNIDVKLSFLIGKLLFPDAN